jgi:hypothetical protein
MDHTIPAVQRAWTIVKRGKPADALVLRSDWPVPQKLEKDEVLIKVPESCVSLFGILALKIS